MAATTASPWSKPGAWALDSEENEAELLQDSISQPPITAVAPAADFPSLSAAAATKQKKKKKQTVSLGEFATYGTAKQAPIGRTVEDLIVLPTGPRERSAEELERPRGGLGGGFKSYGTNNARYGEDNSSRWGSSRLSDEPRRNNNREDREFAPSRADEIDNWAAAKKPIERRGGGGGGGADRERGFFPDLQSKADEVDSWVANKTFTPSAPSSDGRKFGRAFDKRSSFDSLSNGSGTDKRGSFDSLSNGSGADSDTWGRRRTTNNNTILEETNNTVNSAGARPKLVLQPRTLPIEAKEVPPPTTKSTNNPFGEARPREEVLKEKGVDVNEVEKKVEAIKISKEDDKPKKASFGNGWSGEGAWRKPLPQSAEKKENEDVENGHSEDK
ncbi:hypothetical protein ACFE04_013498 [Oxalis oulophora]